MDSFDEKYYSGLTLQELYDEYAKLDKDENPGLAESLFELIKRKEKEEPALYNQNEIRARRRDRFIASIIDTFIFLPFYLLILVYVIISEIQISRDFILDIEIFIIGQIIFLGVNGWLLYKKGQTVGKMTMKIRIVDKNYKTPKLTRSYLMRYLAPSVIALIPFMVIFSFIDVLFIFGKEKRCVHDYMADTLVINDEALLPAADTGVHSD